MVDGVMDDVLGLMAQIVVAHVGRNQTALDELPALIRSVYGALTGAVEGKPAAQTQAPAVAIKSSVFPDYLVCLEDGYKLRTLKRHLHTSHGMTLDQYRDKWRLPADYPMTAPSYAKRRSALAKKIGLGRRPASKPEPLVSILPAHRARGSRG